MAALCSCEKNSYELVETYKWHGVELSFDQSDFEIDKLALDPTNSENGDNEADPENEYRVKVSVFTVNDAGESVLATKDNYTGAKLLDSYQNPRIFNPGEKIKVIVPCTKIRVVFSFLSEDGIELFTGCLEDDKSQVQESEEVKFPTQWEFRSKIDVDISQILEKNYRYNSFWFRITGDYGYVDQDYLYEQMREVTENPFDFDLPLTSQDEFERIIEISNNEVLVDGEPFDGSLIDIFDAYGVDGENVKIEYKIMGLEGEEDSGVSEGDRLSPHKHCRIELTSDVSDFGTIGIKFNFNWMETETEVVTVN